MLMNAAIRRPSGDPLLHLLCESNTFKAHNILPSSECFQGIYDQFAFLVRKLAGFFREQCANHKGGTVENGAHAPESEWVIDRMYQRNTSLVCQQLP